MASSPSCVTCGYTLCSHCWATPGKTAGQTSCREHRSVQLPRLSTGLCQPWGGGGIAMHLVTLREAQILDVARHSWAGDVDSPATVAEALRAELWARQVSTRRALCQRVIGLMQP